MDWSSTTAVIEPVLRPGHGVDINPNLQSMLFRPAATFDELIKSIESQVGSVLAFGFCESPVGKLEAQKDVVTLVCVF